MAELLNTGIVTTEADSLVAGYATNLMQSEESSLAASNVSSRSAEPTIWAGFYWGGVFGTIVGVVLAVFMARGTYMVIPAFGLVIPGPLGGAMCGAIGGFITGGVIGILAALSMREPVDS